MQDALTSNVQSSIRPGAEKDTFYYGDTNSEKQVFSCVVNNRFFQNFTNLTQGTSQFVISPNQGVSDIVLAFQMPSTSSPTATANLPQGWGYSLINQVSIRYGSSAQYFFTGQQIFLQNTIDSENRPKAQSLYVLGGANAIGTGSYGAWAYVYLNLPHSSPAASGKPLPFPSDLLTQPIIITVQLNNPFALVSAGGIWVPGAGSQPIVTSTGLQAAFMQVKQEMMADSADLLARRVDMNTNAYTYPLKYFPQQMVSINLPQAANLDNTGQAYGSISVNLTGFRAGEVRNILLFLTKGTHVSANGNLYFEPITQLQLTYNGEVFYRADSGTADLWNLIGDTKANTLDALTQNGGSTPNPYVSSWVNIPFSQVNIPWDKEVLLVAGKPILNAVVNLSLSVPTSAADYTLNAVYIYNSSLLCSRGGAEYIF
jgi:hypothetical protein